MSSESPNMILVGSRAALARVGSFHREPNDWDIITTVNELSHWRANNLTYIDYLYPNKDGSKYRCKMKSGDSIEFELMDFRPSAQYLWENIIRSGTNVKTISAFNEYLRIPSIAILYLIKRSHIYWPVHWEKNIADLHWLDVRFPRPHEYDHYERTFFELRFRETAAKFGTRKPNLNQTNDEFFAKSEKAIGRILPHDRIHEILKIFDEPIHTMAKRDQSKALMDKDLFFNLDTKYQIAAIKEEAMVIGTERVLLPKFSKGQHIDMDDIKAAYFNGLKKVSTTLTSGWFREFAIDNWPNVNFLPFNFWDRLIDHEADVLLTHHESSHLL